MSERKPYLIDEPGRRREPAATDLPGVATNPALQRRIQRRALQRRADAAATRDDDLTAAAELGTRGPGGPLPFADTIAQAFGRHDVSDVVAHTDADAAAGAQAMGAEAFATGRDVAFAGAPTLHTAAHEAAHVVQQRGGVQLAGGVGAEGDVYERHADLVADQVVAGGSAEALLDASPGSAGGAAVQRKITVGKEQLRYDTPEDAYLALRSTFSTAPEDELRFHLKQLCDTDTGFHNFVSLRHELDRRLSSGHMVGTSAHYGTDVSINASKEDAIENFKAALKAGFRHFDTATFYKLGLGDCSLIALAEAAQQVGVRPDELHVLYKVMPPDHERGVDDEIEDQVEQAGETLSQFPDTLVLHEVTDLEAGKVDLGKLITLVKNKKGKAVGVSNVSLPFLEPLYEYSVQQGVPIKVVQNRFNPYHQDAEVRQFCDTHGIQYLGYSVLGSAQKGVCHEDGQGDPRQYLVPMQDPRVLALAERHNLNAGSMLLSWTHQKGVSAVTFTGSGQKRSEDNLAASRTPLSQTVMDELDALLTTPPKTSDRDFGGKAGLAKLYAALLDPTAWHLMDELAKVTGGAALLDDLANQIVLRNPDPGDQREALRNFALNLMRFAADLQSPANRREKKWHEVMKEQWAALAFAAGGESDAIRDLCIEWACKNSELGGHAQNAMQDIEQIISEEYVPTRPITQTGRDNQPAPIVLGGGQQVAPQVGQSLTLTVANVGQICDMETYALTPLAEMVVGRVYSVQYLGQSVGVTVTAIDLGAGTVTATVDPDDD
ncbi:MAG: aldo/keto reductase [Kofleriaceae bacterium]|nr:aldo/keto reductase [Kofleriaceae bacterium]MBP9167931.1 aldo/keto reductase [Kofleriaceae bacterium]MBP9856765.1 aldo/keto reductase [Kofleriaceae bacterium]